MMVPCHECGEYYAQDRGLCSECLGTQELMEMLGDLVEVRRVLEDRKRVGLVRRYLISRIEDLKLFGFQRRAMLLEGVHFTIEKKAPSVHCTE